MELSLLVRRPGTRLTPFIQMSSRSISKFPPMFGRQLRSGAVCSNFEPGGFDV